MDNLSDILFAKDFEQPPEMAAIKRYVKEHFSMTVGVRVQEKVIIITARSAPMVSQLRLHTHQLQKACGTGKKLVFRIG